MKKEVVVEFKIYKKTGVVAAVACINLIFDC